MDKEDKRKEQQIARFIKEKIESLDERLQVGLIIIRNCIKEAL